MAVDPISDSSGYGVVTALGSGLSFQDYGSYGLRQYGGWVREEYLSELVGREGARAYREMLDGSAVVGGMIFAIMQSMRKVAWRIRPQNDSAQASAEAEFVESLMVDMTHTWEDFVTEALSMLGYGYAPHEIVYKRRLGKRPGTRPGPRPGAGYSASEFADGRIGWRRLPIRGQDTIIKWFFDQNGQVKGLTQQPWVGSLIDIPIEKLLLFRPLAHKNNPEGRSVLRNAYRSWFFVKRLEEQEAVMIERLNGFPVMYLPTKLLDDAAANNPQASAALQAYKRAITNIRVDEQMGLLLPSDVYVDAEGKPSAAHQFKFELVTPQHRSTADTDKTIARHKIDMMTTLLCDFIILGHEVRGTNNLAVTKVDMFYAAIESWLNSVAAVMNRYALPRIWAMNGLNPDLMPEMVPDMAQRLDLDSLGAYVANMAASGMPLFPDEELQSYLREAAGLPEDTDPQAVSAIQGNQETLKRIINRSMAREVLRRRGKAVDAG